MELADEGSGAGEPPERAFLSPGKALALLLGVILALGAAVFLLRPAAPAEPTVTSDPPAPTFELSDAEAVARFESLESLVNEAFESRDESLLSLVYTADSPVVGIASKEIRQLRRDRVHDRSTFETVEFDVISNTPERIVLRQSVEIESLFVTESGKDITQEPRNSLQVVEWTLKLENGEWQIHDSLIKRSRVIR